MDCRVSSKFGLEIEPCVLDLSKTQDLLGIIKGVPGNANARLLARPRAENWVIWQNQVPVARTSVTGHARAHPLHGL